MPTDRNPARLPAGLRWHAAPVAYLILAGAYLALGLSHASGTAMVLLLGVGGFGLGMGFTAQLGRLTSALPARYAPDLSGLVNTTAQLSGVVGVATFGTLYLAMAGRPAHAFTLVMTAFAATALVAATAARAAGRAVAADLNADLGAVPGETASLTRSAGLA